MKEIIIGKYNEDGNIESLITELILKEENSVLDNDGFKFYEAQISNDLQNNQK